MTPDRAAGVLLHPVCLPGPHGCGDLGANAHRFVDWLAASGQRYWQMLPLGEVGPGNSPYMSPSSLAGNVLLIDLAPLAQAGWLEAEALAPGAALDSGRTDYDAVRGFKLPLLQRACARFMAAPGDAQRAHFHKFCHAERDWLDDYALFMALTQALPGRTWAEWDGPLAQREPAALARAARERAEPIGFWKFCQWLFRAQWSALRQHAHRRRVRLIGDLPIFPAMHSAEVWANPELFELDAAGRPTEVAGVPPDYFSQTGQRWGNPLYRWPAHRAQSYAWWIERLRRLESLFDVIRIDHFRGFAACWHIPAHEATAMHGRWVPGPGAELFEALRRALGPLPLIAEDLGIISEDVTLLRRQFELPGMHVLQFAFGSDSRNPHLPHRHERNGVVYTGTHDNDTAIGWWQQAGPREREFASLYLGTDGRQIHWDLIRAASASVAGLAIFPLQDILGLDGAHRLNHPGHSTGCWEWRFGWNQVEPWQGEQLAALCGAHGRCEGEAHDR